MTRKIRIFGLCCLGLLMVLAICVLHFKINVFGTSERPNIVLIILDTVRSDYTDDAKLRKGLTPQLKRLAAESTVFPNSWANAPWTVPSHASLFTGMTPSQHSCNAKHYFLDKKHLTLAAALGESGYQTAAFFSNPWLNVQATGLTRDFQEVRETWIGGLGNLSLGSGNQGGPLANSYIKDWFKKKRDPEKPFFLFVNYLEAHLPYDPDPEFRKKHLQDLRQKEMITIEWAHQFNAGLHNSDSVDWQKVRRLYGGDVYTADALLGTLIGIMKEMGIYENTIIIVTSDHGEHLGEHGLLDHQFSVHENLLSIPMVIRAPGILEKGIDERPALLSDLFATIMEAAGVGDNEDSLFSRSLFRKEKKKKVRAANKPGRYIVSEYAGAPENLLVYFQQMNPKLDTTPLSYSYKTVTDGKWRLTVSSGGKKILSNLEKDPGQTKDFSHDFPDQVRRMDKFLKEVFSAIKSTTGKKRTLDEKTRKKLESLGYIN